MDRIMFFTICSQQILHGSWRENHPFFLTVVLQGAVSALRNVCCLPRGGAISRSSVDIVTGIIATGTGCRLITTVQILKSGKTAGYETSIKMGYSSIL